MNVFFTSYINERFLFSTNIKIQTFVRFVYSTVLFYDFSNVCSIYSASPSILAVYNSLCILYSIL